MSTNQIGVASPWQCDVCGDPVDCDTGYLEIFNLDEEAGPVGGYPRRPKPEEPKLAEVAPGEIVFVPYSDVPPPPEPCIGFRCVHTDCDWNDQQGYWLPIKEIDTYEAWMDSVWHVGGKTWMSKGDLLNLIAFYWVNRGQESRWLVDCHAPWRNRSHGKPGQTLKAQRA